MRYLVFLLLSGCSININNLPPPSIPQPIYAPPTQCPVYVPPEVAELPKLPAFNQLDVRDRVAVEKLLIQLIKEHREYVHALREAHSKQYQDYLLTCNQK